MITNNVYYPPVYVIYTNLKFARHLTVTILETESITELDSVPEHPSETSNQEHEIVPNELVMSVITRKRHNIKPSVQSLP